MRTNLSSYQWRVLIAVWRKTYGWNKKEDRIPVTQLSEMTEIHKAHVSRTKKELVARNILVTHPGNKIAFNKDWQAWRELPNGVTRKKVTRWGTKVTQRGNKKLPDGADSKEKKETIQKKIYKAQAGELLEFYISHINPTRKSKERALDNLVSHLHRHSKDDLKTSVLNYETIALQSEPLYRKDPANFFGIRPAAFKDYLPGKFKPPEEYQTDEERKFLATP